MTIPEQTWPLFNRLLFFSNREGNSGFLGIFPYPGIGARKLTKLIYGDKNAQTIPEKSDNIYLSCDYSTRTVVECLIPEDLWLALFFTRTSPAAIS